MTATRLRQVALVARSLSVADELRQALGLGEPYHDRGVGSFGLENAVFPVGDCFLEVVAPVKEGTTAGRYLDKRGGDGGYMAIFQLPHIDQARQRVADLGIRVVWQHDLDHIGGTHLHPKDVPGAIVSLDWADPPGSWHWAGPEWSGREPEHDNSGIVGLTVAAADPAAVAHRWAEVLDVPLPGGATEMLIAAGDQVLRFVPATGASGEGISEVDLAVPAAVRQGRREVVVGGVRFRLVPCPGEDG